MKTIVGLALVLAAFTAGVPLPSHDHAIRSHDVHEETYCNRFMCHLWQSRFNLDVCSGWFRHHCSTCPECTSPEPEPSPSPSPDTTTSSSATTKSSAPRGHRGGHEAHDEEPDEVYMEEAALAEALAKALGED